jgi:hypothetical protein
MKNVQIIDGADNCGYCVFQASSEDFDMIFPDGKDVEFIDDFFDRVGDQKAETVLSNIWKHRVSKKEIVGLHGTLFFQLAHKKVFYPNKKETDLDERRPQQSEP